MKKGKRVIAALSAAALVITSIPVNGPGSVQAEDADRTVGIRMGEVSTFNDTNGDGLGEFEGWGTSLCWWANRIGGSEKMVRQAGELFFGDTGLDLNIGRYNVGGGDLVSDDLSGTEVLPNEKAEFYDLETEGKTPEYSGTSMKVSTGTWFSDAKYFKTDGDFGFRAGETVGSMKTIGYIKGIDGETGTGDNLHYTVNAKEAGSHTFKILATMDGLPQTRGIVLRVNGTEDYVIETEKINANPVARTGNRFLYVAEISGVELQAGENTVEIGGSNGEWCLDFIKMAVIPSGEEAILSVEQEYLHKEHITRSDSDVPGYAKDVTKIVLTNEKDMKWYEDNFVRADEECGYAWNYDWDADRRQFAVLRAAKEASGEEFIAEAFSNSPPYFMTVSGCTSGAVRSAEQNIRPDSYHAFAKYMADVIEHWNDEGVIRFDTVSPMNEPDTDYWGAYSYKQEGCRIAPGEAQSAVLTALHEELEAKGLGDIILSGTDETSIDTQIRSYNALSDEAKGVIERIDTHTYGGSRRAELSALAETEGKNLWMSEVDGSYTAGTDAGEMTPALGLAQRIFTDMNGLKPSAWILWNAIDKYADAKSDHPITSTANEGYDFADMDALYAATNMNGGHWGVLFGDFNNEELVLTKKYYGFGQFTRYIRPGYTIIPVDANTLAAYDSEGKKLVIVAMNTSSKDVGCKFAMPEFIQIGNTQDITAIRTSGDLATGENWADVTADSEFIVDAAAKTITATLKSNSITTYTIENCVYDGSITTEEVKLNADSITDKSNPWNNDESCDATHVVDGNLNSFFDGVSNGYFVIDLKEVKNIAGFAYAPRSGYADRCKGAKIAGSNDGKNWTLLYTVPAVPPTGTYTYVYAEQFATSETNWQYIKYFVEGSSSNCNIAEFKVFETVRHIEEGVTAHYDMSMEGNVLTDISGNENHASVYDAKEEDFVSFGGETVMQFDNRSYAELPSGLIGEDGVFTIQTTVSSQVRNNAWLWCLGQGVGEWNNDDVGDYIFVSPKSAQNGYQDKLLSAIKVGSVKTDESRMPAPEEVTPNGYVTITVVSDGTNLAMYLDGVKVSELAHGKDIGKVIPDGDVLGYIGHSLFAPDPKLSAHIADMKIWNKALTQEEMQKQLPTTEEKRAMYAADIRKALLNGNETEQKITGDVKFPSSVDGVDITWNVPENEAIDSKGNVTIPAGKDVEVAVCAAFTVDGSEQTVTFNLKVLGDKTENILNAAFDALDIPNKEDVRGNITLPEKMDGGVTVSWTTSHPDIVHVESQEVPGEEYDKIPAGVVERPQKDTEVTLTATLKLENLTKEKVVKIVVKAAPEVIEESDYTDYFFAYFAGEGRANGEQIYFASSKDGMNWDDLNHAEPVLTSTLGEKGVRDPFLLRSPEGDKFYLIATDLKINGGNGWEAAQNEGSQSLMVWESTDLVNWSEQRMVEVSADIDAGCTWAPEATYDSVTGEYVVYWASRVPSKDEKQRIYYAKTRDFYTFTKPEIYIEKDESAIDTTMIEHNGTYYRYTKNEGGNTNELGALTKTIFIEKGENVLGQFTHISSESLNKADVNQWVEGPAIFQLNADDAKEDTWCLLVDNYGAGGYYPLVTNDLESGIFTRPDTETYRMPSYARHGTPIRITAEEYEAISVAYDAPEEVMVATYPGETPKLPEKVTYIVDEKEVQKEVKWNLDGVVFEAEPFKYVNVTGKVEGRLLPVTAKVQIVPEKLEYMIDSNNPESSTWKNAKALGADLLNAEAADQAKSGANTWGYSSSVGAGDAAVDMTAFGQSSISNPYAGGWWAHGGKNITYKLTLPKGVHQILAGVTGWWNMDRPMDVYYSVDEGNAVKLFDLDAVKSKETYAQGTITLDYDAVVTISIRAAGSGDPILSWLAVTGEGKQEVKPYTAFTGTNGEMQFDTDGNRIQAHGGQVQKLTVDGETKYFWYGEDKTNGYRPVTGVHLYTSTDLYNWKDEGVVLRSIPVAAEEYEKGETNLDIFTEDEYFAELYGDYEGKPSDMPDLYESKLEETYWNLAEDRCVIERPKMIYNEETEQYVIWFHADGHTPKSNSNYGKAQAGVAVADNPYGPFKLLGTYDLYYSKDVDYGALNDHPGALRDMNLFVDTDKTAYISYSSEMNQTTYIGKLNASYTGLAAEPDKAVEGEHFTRNFIGQSREASAMFHYDETYYMITSGCTGWTPNQAQYAVAETPLGPWTTMGDPCVGDISKTTFDTQSTCVIPVDAENGKYIYMGDRWYNSSVNGGELYDSRYVWLPVEFGEGNKIAIRDYSNWTLEELGAKEEKVFNGGFENDLNGWSHGNTASLADENAVEGKQYVTEERDSGISQWLPVEPNTEYIMTGKAYPGEKAEYWIGAEVDGREIYAVFSQDVDYKDNTDNADKLAYHVYPGATGWTDFEVKFTTGDATRSVKIYTWVSGGGGLADAISVKKVQKEEPEEPVKTEKLEKAIAEAKTVLENRVTPSSWKALKKAIQKAEAALADAKAEKLTQEQTDAEAEALNTVVKDLKPMADFSALKKAIEDAEAEGTDKYTEESIKVLADALAAGKRVYENKEADQEQVEAAVKAIQAAVDGLEEKPSVEEPEPEEKPVTAISFGIDKISMVRGEENHLVVIVLPVDADGADEITWKSSDESVLTVDEKGKIKALKPGTVTVTATAGGKSAKLTIVVTLEDVVYADVRKDDWYYDAVNWAYNNGVMTGYDTGYFGPADFLTRAQFATILYRLEGSPELDFADIYPDVKEGYFYSDAVTWASEKEIITGYTDTGLFCPNDRITREQLAVMLYRYAKMKEMDVTTQEELTEFPDAEKVSEYAAEAMRWAVEKAIIKGDERRLNPQGFANRAEAATMMMRFDIIK